jgi:hypothetical protein
VLGFDPHTGEFILPHFFGEQMYIPNGDWFDLFLEVFTQTGGRKFSEPKGHNYSKSTWRGNLVWLVPKEGGQELQGEGIEDLTEYWKETVKEASKFEGEEDGI